MIVLLVSKKDLLIKHAGKRWEGYTSRESITRASKVFIIIQPYHDDYTKRGKPGSYYSFPGH